MKRSDPFLSPMYESRAPDRRVELRKAFSPERSQTQYRYPGVCPGSHDVLNLWSQENWSARGKSALIVMSRESRSIMVFSLAPTSLAISGDSEPPKALFWVFTRYCTRGFRNIKATWHRASESQNADAVSRRSRDHSGDRRNCARHSREWLHLNDRRRLCMPGERRGSLGCMPTPDDDSECSSRRVYQYNWLCRNRAIRRVVNAKSGIRVLWK